MINYAQVHVKLRDAKNKEITTKNVPSQFLIGKTASEIHEVLANLFEIRKESTSLLIGNFNLMSVELLPHENPFIYAPDLVFVTMDRKFDKAYLSFLILRENTEDQKVRSKILIPIISSQGEFLYTRAHSFVRPLKPQTLFKSLYPRLGASPKSLVLYSRTNSVLQDQEYDAELIYNKLFVVFNCTPHQKSRIIKRTLLIKEIVATEENYIRNLEILIKEACPYLKKHKILPDLLCDSLVTNTNILVEYHKSFLESLKSVQRGYDSNIGSVFLAKSASFKVIQPYLSNYPTITSTISSKSEDPKIARIINEFQDQCSEKIAIISLLYCPVHRFSLYHILLREVIKETPDTHPDHQNLRNAYEKMRELSEEIDKKQAAQQANLLMQDLAKKFEDRVFDSARTYVNCYYATIDGAEKLFYIFSDCVWIAYSLPNGKLKKETSYSYSELTLWPYQDTFVYLNGESALQYSLESREKRDEFIQVFRKTSYKYTQGLPTSDTLTVTVVDKNLPELACHSMVQIDGHLFMFGGVCLSSLANEYLYDYSLDSQTVQSTKYPEALTPRVHPAMCEKDKRIYIYGGDFYYSVTGPNSLTSSDEFWCYDTSSKQWTQLPRGPPAMKKPCLLSYEKVLMLAGTGKVFEIWLYNLDTEEWSSVEVPKLLYKYTDFRMVKMDEGEGLFIGGKNGKDTYFGMTLMYSQFGRRMFVLQTSGLEVANRSGHIAAKIGDDVVVWGGEKEDEWRPMLLDSVVYTWKVPRLDKLLDTQLSYPACIVCNGSVYVHGGYDSLKCASKKLYIIKKVKVKEDAVDELKDLIEASPNDFYTRMLKQIYYKEKKAALEAVAAK